MAKRTAQGSGSIRKKTITRNGKEYIYWEARITVGRDPGTGKQIQRSFTGKTQKEVREKMQAVAVAVNSGTYIEPQKMTIGEWLDIWLADYLGGVKPSTATTYTKMVKNHIKPALGAVPLKYLHPHTVQQFINRLKLAPASVHLTYQIIHGALNKAVKLGYIPKNPADDCELPRIERQEVQPLTDEQIAALLAAVTGCPLEHMVKVALFTGLRQSELLGLTWDCIDFTRGTLNINKQLAKCGYWQSDGLFISPKNGKGRVIQPAASVMQQLHAQWLRQKELQLKAGRLWNNAANLVFTNELGGPLEQNAVRQRFLKLAASVGITSARFHDLRHTYAVNAIRAGDDIKTIQSNLGHASAAFTLNKYGHFTVRMQQDSAARMESFINRVLNL